MLVFNSASQVSKSPILSEALILVWAHLQGRERLISCRICLNLGQWYFYIFVVQMMYAVVWKQYFSLINHISENGKHMKTEQMNQSMKMKTGIMAS